MLLVPRELGTGNAVSAPICCPIAAHPSASPHLCGTKRDAAVAGCQPAIVRPINHTGRNAGDSYEMAQPSWSRQAIKYSPPVPRSHSRAQGCTRHSQPPALNTVPLLQNTAKHCKKGHFAPVPGTPGASAMARGIREEPPPPRLHSPAHPWQTCPKQFIPGLNSPPGLLTCPCSALTTVVDWSTWLQQPQLFMVIAELIIK